MISIVSKPGTGYPSMVDGGSPSEVFPEAPFRAVAASPNAVYAMVREVLRQAGLDAERFGTPAWNPLGSWIRPGASVFVLCNFVYHRRPQESEGDLQAKVIHGAVLRALLDYVLIATGPSGRVRFGNAPLQSCRWDRVLSESGAEAVLGFFRGVGADVDAVDLRGEIVDRDLLGRVRVRDVRDVEATPRVEIDLGASSVLEIGTSPGGAWPRYRVADYDPDRTESFHRPGSHRYVIHREILDADVVVSLPKLKTHEKVGITCVVKGFVGAVARKECLAHHRFGPPSRGGDEYPDHLSFLVPLSRFHDWVNRGSGIAGLRPAGQVIDRTARRVLRRLHVGGAGAWHGNDTAWRMALDLARILCFADRGGVVRDRPQRGHLALIDGIVGGEGDGPLSPSPVPAGTLIFSDDVLDADRAACRIMGFDPALVPTIAFAERGRPGFADFSADPSDVAIVNGASRAVAELPELLGRAFVPPRGWRGRLEAGR